MKNILTSAIAASALLFTISCKTDFDTDVKDVVVSKGSADFSKFVSLGNSLTSGYSNGALYIDGQNESFPSMMAQQMKLAGGGEFKQPLMSDNLGGIKAVGFLDKLELKLINGSLAPSRNEDPTKIMGASTLASIFATGPYQNMGVPGAKSFHLGLQGYGDSTNLPAAANPYFVRFASASNASVIGDAVDQSPTFFSLWIGNNDVLSYATSGGSGVDQNQAGNLNPATYGSNDITHPSVLASVISSYVNALTANGAKGVIANIPNVTSIPYFTTVPAKPISGLTAAQVSQLNTAYAAYNAGLAQVKALIGEAEYNQRLIKFTEGLANGAVIVDKDLTDLSKYGIPSYRQTTLNDFVLLPASTILRAGGGTATALADHYVLTEKETARVLTATAAYNAAIKSIADAKGLAFVDANAKMLELSKNSGISFNGVKYTATFVTGGAFSLDGVHLTGRGYAVIANEFMKQINAKYGSTLPMVNVNKYSGVKFP